MASFSPLFWVRQKLENIHFTKDTLRSLLPALISVVAVFITLCIAFVYISISTGTGFFDLWGSFYYAAFGSASAIGRMLTKATHILIVTIGLIIAFKSGLFNIGGVGQIAVGAILGAGPGPISPFANSYQSHNRLRFSVPSFRRHRRCIRLVQSRFNIDEIFTTLMVGFVLVAILNYFIDGPWGQTGSAEGEDSCCPRKFPIHVAGAYSVDISSH